MVNSPQPLFGAGIKPRPQPQPVGGFPVETKPRKRRDWPVIAALLLLWVAGYTWGFFAGYFADHQTNQVHIKRVMV